MLLGARGGDVEDASLLGLVGLALGELDPLELLGVDRARAQRGKSQADLPVVGDAQRAGLLAPVLAEVGDADDRELEALGAVHGHQPHGVELLGLERRLALALGDQVALGDRVDEAAQVAALLGLVVARHPHQLAHVGHAPVAGGQRQHVLVVAGLADSAVDQRLERHRRRAAALRLEDAHEALDAAPVGVRQLREQLGALAQHPPGVPPGRARLEPDQRDRVERGADERRGQQRVERQLVERVRQRRQPVAQVGHLLLAPVAAPADDVRRHAALLQRPLVAGHVGRGAQQQHDVATAVGAALAGQLVDAAGQQARLERAPGCDRAQALTERVLALAGEPLVPAALVLVDDQQLDGRVDARRLGARVRALAQRLEVLAPELARRHGRSRPGPRRASGSSS